MGSFMRIVRPDKFGRHLCWPNHTVTVHTDHSVSAAPGSTCIASPKSFNTELCTNLKEICSDKKTHVTHQCWPELKKNNHGLVPKSMSHINLDLFGKVALSKSFSCSQYRTTHLISPSCSHVRKIHILSRKSNFNLLKADILKAYTVRNFSSESIDNKLLSKVEDDPELKVLLKQITQDFNAPKKPEATNNIDTGSSSSSSDSESDSSSDSDSSSSDSDTETASKVDTTDQGSSNQVPSSSSDPFARLDITGIALSESNIDGTVIDEEEEELNEEEDYEDFYHDFEDVEEDIQERNYPISLERGATGVYDIKELVTLLSDENARDMCVMQLPADYKYVDHMVIVTGRSTRHLRAMAELVRKVYKYKRGRKDPPTVKIEGHQTTDWMALDLGNIALHLFLADTRVKYDLETLWTVGEEFDSQPKEEEDPFALFIDQVWAPKQLEPEKKTESPPSNDQTSMDSVAGWHGPSSSASR